MPCPCRRPRRSNFVLTPLGAMEVFRPGKRLVNVLGVVGPVGRDVHRAAGRKAVGAERQEAWLDDAPFVMTLFRPRVGKVEIDARQTPARDLVLEHLDRVVRDEPEIGHAGFVRGNQAMPHARVVNLDAHKGPILWIHFQPVPR